MRSGQRAKSPGLTDSLSSDFQRFHICKILRQIYSWQIHARQFNKPFDVSYDIGAPFQTARDSQPIGPIHSSQAAPIRCTKSLPNGRALGAEECWRLLSDINDLRHNLRTWRMLADFILGDSLR